MYLRYALYIFCTIIHMYLYIDAYMYIYTYMIHIYMHIFAMYFTNN